ncbi:hypothetical protein Scep_021594 [Stephania cephalantha]|uniref:RING-type domain-containing protein n=1 Tax=Stephania cephalantha TaxID=152367 RepID=A0AAP0F6B5_9MAGN
MDSDSIANAYVPASKDSSKEFVKKKRGNNRLAKLKQCKMDARREQWLSQVKNKGSKEESNGIVGCVSFSSTLSAICGRENRSLGSREVRSRGDEKEGGLGVHTANSESRVDNNLVSGVSGNQESRKSRSQSSSSSSSSSSTSTSTSTSSSSWCCSRSASEEEEEDDVDDDDGCVDDWEAVADALTADDKQHQPNSEPLVEMDPALVDAAPSELVNKEAALGASEMEHCGEVKGRVENNRAWRLDDAFRPPCLPTLSKQYSFPLNSERCCAHGAVTWPCNGIISQPSPCPICCEDLDPTDYSFLPCLCGFRLCLFCYKRILEADGRCPGCRKYYDPQNVEMDANGGPPQYRLARSFSMSTRF